MRDVLDLMTIYMPGSATGKRGPSVVKYWLDFNIYERLIEKYALFLREQAKVHARFTRSLMGTFTKLSVVAAFSTPPYHS